MANQTLGYAGLGSKWLVLGAVLLATKCTGCDPLGLIALDDIDPAFGDCIPTDQLPPDSFVTPLQFDLRGEVLEVDSNGDGLFTPLSDLPSWGGSDTEDTICETGESDLDSDCMVAMLAFSVIEGPGEGGTITGFTVAWLDTATHRIGIYPNPALPTGQRYSIAWKPGSLRAIADSDLALLLAPIDFHAVAPGGAPPPEVTTTDPPHDPIAATVSPATWVLPHTDITAEFSDLMCGAPFVTSVPDINVVRSDFGETGGRSWFTSQVVLNAVNRIHEVKIYGNESSLPATSFFPAAKDRNGNPLVVSSGGYLGACDTHPDCLGCADGLQPCDFIFQFRSSPGRIDSPENGSVVDFAYSYEILGVFALQVGGQTVTASDVTIRLSTPTGPVILPVDITGLPVIPGETAGEELQPFAVSVPAYLSASQIELFIRLGGTDRLADRIGVQGCGNSILEDGEGCDDGGLMNGDCCDASCQIEAVGSVCRPASGPCDAEDTCDGSTGSCPTDGYKAADQTCRASSGTCDRAEFCSGADASCPADLREVAGTTCRPSIGDCDSPEACDGLMADCGPDQKLAGICRSSAGPCDLAESCDGSGNVCPADVKSTQTCRPSIGLCDVEEACDGAADVCPPDSLQAAGAVCRQDVDGISPSGNCDTAEACDGINAFCPQDTREPAGTQCLGGGTCGTSGYCGVCGDNIVQTGAGEQCDQGLANGAPTSCCGYDCHFKAAGTVCRADMDGPPPIGNCDKAEFCSGASATCPVDARESNGQACLQGTALAGTCSSGRCGNCGNNIVNSPAEECDLSTNTGKPGTCCTADCQFANGGAVCGPVLGPCDAGVETCSGTTGTCPTNAFRPNTTVCRAQQGICDKDDKCPGNGVNCSPDLKLTSTTTCRPSSGNCDIAEVCNSIDNTCPQDLFQVSSLVCRSSAGACDVPESCPGDSGICPADQKSTGVCRAASDLCDAVETCDGVANTCPADTVLPAGSACRADADGPSPGGGCDIGEVCTGSAKACPSDGFAPAGTVCDGWLGCSPTGGCTCGNGPVNPGESCDDGDISDCTTACNKSCTGPHEVVCGDGVSECGEACDDGDASNCTTACNSQCAGPHLVVCGDGVAECGEACDSGPVNGDPYECDTACAADCTPAHSWSIGINSTGTGAKVTANGIAATSSGTVYVAGSFKGTLPSIGLSNSGAGENGFVNRYNSLGTKTGQFKIRASDPSKNVRILGVVAPSSGSSIYVLGTFEGVIFQNTGFTEHTTSLAGELFIAKYNAFPVTEDNPTPNYVVAFGTTASFAKMTMDASGSPLVVATIPENALPLGIPSNPIGGGASDIMIVKFTPSNLIYSSDMILETGTQSVSGVYAGWDGSIYVTGNVQLNGGFGAAPVSSRSWAGSCPGNPAIAVPDTTNGPFAARLDPNGCFEWLVYPFGNSDASSIGVAGDGQGNLYMTGLFKDRSGAPFCLGGVDSSCTGGMSVTTSGGTSYFTYLARISDGTVDWLHGYPVTGSNNTPRALSISRQGVIELAGQLGGTISLGPMALSKSASSTSAYLAQFETVAGTPLWAKAYGSSQTDISTTYPRSSLADEPSQRVTYLAGNYSGTPNMGGGALANGSLLNYYLMKIERAGISPCNGCGDGVVDADGIDNIAGNFDDEACDDGDLLESGGCNRYCQGFCGNSIVETFAELCDDGPGEGEGLCTDDCSGVQACGDGLTTGTELCDDGNTLNCVGTCSGDCLRTAGCGDGAVCGGEICDDGNTSDCAGSCRADCMAPSGCGDGRVCPGELCDDGNLMEGDCCDSLCRFDPPGRTCGPKLGECDLVDVCNGAGSCFARGLAQAGQMCRESGADCDLSEHCNGNGVDCPADVSAANGEPCDGDGTFCNGAELCTSGVCVSPGIACVPGSHCNESTHACIPDACGNGMADPGELCDDGNADDCDGCGTSCVPSAGLCGDGLAQCVEECDDGNVYSGDGCTSMCALEDQTCGEPRLALGLGGAVFGFATDGTKAVAARGWAGISVFNMTDPAGPVLEARFSYEGNAQDVAIFGDSVAVADGSNGVVFIDIQNPAAPAILQKIALPGYCESLGSYGGKVFVAAGAGGIHVLSQSPPGEYSLERTLATAGPAKDVHIEGGRLYVALGDGGVSIYDLSGGGAPLPIGGMATLSGSIGVAKSHQLMAVARADSGLDILDVSNPANPVLRHHLDGISPVDVEIYWPVAYVMQRQGGIIGYDISDPTTLVAEWQYYTQRACFDLDASEGMLYGSTERGIEVFDVAAGGPKVGEDPDGSFGDVIAMAAEGDTVALSSNAGGGSRLLGVSALPTIDDDLQPILDGGAVLGISGTILLKESGDTVQIIDISDPGNPTQASILAGYRAVAGKLIGDQSKVFLLDSSSGLLCQVDLSTPSTPAVEGCSAIDGELADIAIGSGLLLVAYKGGALKAYDYSNASNLVEVGLLQKPYRAIAVLGDRLLASYYASGQELLELSSVAPDGTLGVLSSVSTSEPVSNIIRGGAMFFATGVSSIYAVDPAAFTQGNVRTIAQAPVPSWMNPGLGIADTLLAGGRLAIRFASGGVVLIEGVPGLCSAYCGNGHLETGEECDDGNILPGDGCGTGCHMEICGNGLVDAANEVCDDGNFEDGDGCSSDCLSDESCGNGLVDITQGELCDDGNLVDGDGCESDCFGTGSCGDGFVQGEQGEICDDGGRCADNGMPCDTYNRSACESYLSSCLPISGDGCSADCRSLEICGNSIMDILAGELCDDGNQAAGDGCSANCYSNESCGNSVIDSVTGEVCDDGNHADCDGCSPDCSRVLVGCGDGWVCGPEVCDDGNTAAGDGCSPDCGSVEACGNGVVDGGEECDDGNLMDGDCCTSVCNLDPADSVCNGTPSACIQMNRCDATGGCLAIQKADGESCGRAATQCDNGMLCEGGICVDHGIRTNGTACAGNGITSCSVADACLQGVCSNYDKNQGVKCGGNNGNVCSLGRYCDGAGGCVESLKDDGTACGRPQSQCDNGEICDGGQCSDGGYSSQGSTCDDGLFCTQSDTCDGTGGCAGTGDPCEAGRLPGECAHQCNEYANNCSGNLPYGSSCDDEKFCTLEDFCDSEGSCLGYGSPCAGEDGDQNCTESCNEAADDCTAADPAGSGCSDGLFCTASQACDGTGGCVGSGDPCAVGNACNSLCNEGNDHCYNPFATTCDFNPGAPADAGVCNGRGSCSNLLAVQSVCAAGNEPCCSGQAQPVVMGEDPDGDCSPSGQACMKNACDGLGGCMLMPSATLNSPVSCDDGQFCTFIDQCNPETGICEGVSDPCGFIVSCDSYMECDETSNLCIQYSGVPCPGADGDENCSESCFEDPDVGANCSAPDGEGSSCDDGIWCSVGEYCQSGQCIGFLAYGGDGDYCNGEEYCSETALAFVSSGDPCEFGKECNQLCNSTDNTCHDPEGTECHTNPSSMVGETNPDPTFYLMSGICDGQGTCDDTECGNGEIEGGELCDDGHLNGTRRSCNSLCTGRCLDYARWTSYSSFEYLADDHYGRTAGVNSLFFGGGIPWTYGDQILTCPTGDWCSGVMLFNTEDGTALWSAIITGTRQSDEDFSSAVAEVTGLFVDLKGHIYIAGIASGTLSIGALTHNSPIENPNSYWGFVAKLSPDGDPQWIIHAASQVGESADVYLRSKSLAGDGRNLLYWQVDLSASPYDIAGNNYEIGTDTANGLGVQGNVIIIQIDTITGSVNWINSLDWRKSYYPCADYDCQVVNSGPSLVTSMASDAWGNVYIDGEIYFNMYADDFLLERPFEPYNDYGKKHFLARLDHTGAFTWLMSTDTYNSLYQKRYTFLAGGGDPENVYQAITRTDGLTPVRAGIRKFTPEQTMEFEINLASAVAVPPENPEDDPLYLGSVMITDIQVDMGYPGTNLDHGDGQMPQPEPDVGGGGGGEAADGDELTRRKFLYAVGYFDDEVMFQLDGGAVQFDPALGNGFIAGVSLNTEDEDSPKLIWVRQLPITLGFVKDCLSYSEATGDFIVQGNKQADMIDGLPISVQPNQPVMVRLGQDIFGGPECAFCGNQQKETGERCDYGYDLNSGLCGECGLDCSGPGSFDFNLGPCPVCGNGDIEGRCPTVDDTPGPVCSKDTPCPDGGECDFFAFEECEPSVAGAEHCYSNCHCVQPNCWDLVGDGMVDTTWEECDDGNKEDDDGCSAFGICENEKCLCGVEVEGTVEVDSWFEFCDEGELNDSGDGHCLGDCSGIQECGDGITSNEEVCDDGISDGGGSPVFSNCTSDCTATVESQFCGPDPLTSGTGNVSVCQYGLDSRFMNGQESATVDGHGIGNEVPFCNFGGVINDDLATSTSDAFWKPLTPYISGLSLGPVTIVSMRTNNTNAKSMNDLLEKYPLHAFVYYPDPLSGPYPVIVIAHGNHNSGNFSCYPLNDWPNCELWGSLKGYQYAAEALASNGFIVISVDFDLLTSAGSVASGGSQAEFDARALVLLYHLSLWRDVLNASGGMFIGQADMSNVGLIGHSRGGEAALTAWYLNLTRPEITDDLRPFDGSKNRTDTTGTTYLNWDFSIKGIYQIAATAYQGKTVLAINKADGPAYFLIAGSRDGDLVDFQSLQTYEGTYAAGNSNSANSKSMSFLLGANHNRFNSVWDDDGVPTMSRGQQEDINTANLVAFFKYSLYGETLANEGLLKGAECQYAWNNSSVMIKQHQDSNRKIIASWENGVRYYNDQVKLVLFGNEKDDLLELMPSPILNATNPEYIDGASRPLGGFAKLMPGGELVLDLPEGNSAGPEGRTHIGLRGAFMNSDNRQNLDPPNSKMVVISLTAHMGDPIRDVVSRAVPLAKFGTLPWQDVDAGGIHPVMGSVRIPLSLFTAAIPESFRGDFVNSITQITIRYLENQPGTMPAQPPLAIDDIQWTD